MHDGAYPPPLPPKRLYSPGLRRTVLPGHQHPTILPHPFRLVHRRKEARPHRHLARRDRLSLVGREREPVEEERDDGLARGDFLSVRKILRFRM